MEGVGLSEASPAYHGQADIYKTFRDAEDAAGTVATVIRNFVTNKTVLDVCCGSAVYARMPAKRYIGLDRSAQLLNIARQTAPLADLCLADAMRMPFADNSVDAVFSTWGVGSADADKRGYILEEIERVLRPGGSTLFVENAETGAFQEIRGPQYQEKTHAYNTWLEQQGFTRLPDVHTAFTFASGEVAQTTVRSLWGDTVAERVNSATIPHRVAIFLREEMS